MLPRDELLECRSTDAVAFVDDLTTNGVYEVCFLDESVFLVEADDLELRSLNDLKSDQVETIRQIKDKFLEPFFHIAIQQEKDHNYGWDGLNLIVLEEFQLKAPYQRLTDCGATGRSLLQL